MTVGNFLKKTVCWPAVLLFILSIGGASASLGYPSAGVLHSGYRETIETGMVAKILTVLEIRNADQKAMDKTAEKLFTMNKQDLRLISSLCDRISADGGTVGADIAFSLITAMIVLS